MGERIAVIAGTSDARQLIESFSDKEVSIVAFVATKLGREMLEPYTDFISICEGRKNQDEFRQSFLENKIERVIDASHPFAKVVTQTVSAVCAELSLPYERIKREQESYDYEKIIWAEDAREAAEIAAKLEGVILLTTGANTAEIYAAILPDMEERLYIRVLDTQNSIRRCQKAKIPGEHIIAKMPPFSVEDNLAAIEAAKASVLISKDSGRQGGVREKAQACRIKNIPMILIKRPKDSNEYLEMEEEKDE